MHLTIKFFSIFLHKTLGLSVCLATNFSRAWSCWFQSKASFLIQDLLLFNQQHLCYSTLPKLKAWSFFFLFVFFSFFSEIQNWACTYIMDYRKIPDKFKLLHIKFLFRKTWRCILAISPWMKMYDLNASVKVQIYYDIHAHCNVKSTTEKPLG